VSWQALAWAAQVTRGDTLRPITKVVLFNLASFHQMKNGRGDCFPKQETLAAAVGVSVSCLNDHLNILEALGLVVRERSYDCVRRHRGVTRYRLPVKLQTNFSAAEAARAAAEEEEEEALSPLAEVAVSNSAPAEEAISEPNSAPAETKKNQKKKKKGSLSVERPRVRAKGVQKGYETGARKGGSHPEDPAQFHGWILDRLDLPEEGLWATDGERDITARWLRMLMGADREAGLALAACLPLFMDARAETLADLDEQVARLIAARKHLERAPA
jgi:DNA-binding MarR family transcriptional regulator